MVFFQLVDFYCKWLGNELIGKLRKACETLSATIYPVDPVPEKRREDALEIISRLEDLKHVLDGTKSAIRNELLKVCHSCFYRFLSCVLDLGKFLVVDNDPHKGKGDILSNELVRIGYQQESFHC